MDALKYFGIDFSWVRGPMYIFFDPDMDEEWRLLIQAAGLFVVLVAIYYLDKFGAFVHIKSRRATVPPLLVALCEPEGAADLRALAVRRGVVDDKLTAEEEANYVDLPRRGEEVELVCGPRKLAGIVLEAGTPRVSEQMRKEWAQRMKNRGITVLLLKPEDSVIATLLEHKLDGRILKWRFPRFLQRAYKRRANRQDEVKTFVTFFSSERKRVMAVVPISSGFAKEVLRGLPALESAKSK